jgi:phage tail-like protein
MRGAAVVLILLLVPFVLGTYTRPNEATLEWGFQIACEGHEISGYFTEVSGISNQNEWECERFTAPNGHETTSCLPSQLVVAPLVLKRTLTSNDDFWNWRDQVANGLLTTARDNCSLSILNRDYSYSHSYQVFNAWPASVEIKPLGTMEQDYLQEDPHHKGKLRPGKVNWIYFIFSFLIN